MKWAVGILLALGINLAHAADEAPAAHDKGKWKSECGSCHVAYPPQFLAASDWQQIMGRLDQHFGENASLDSKDNKQILGYLLRHAGSGDLYSASTLRISDTPWFKRLHHVISSKEWARSDVNSRSNCSACHGKVVLGD